MSLEPKTRKTKQDFSGKQFSSLQMRVSDKSITAPRGSAQIKGKHNNAISACRYLEDHNIAGIMRVLVKELLAARPVKPALWIQQNAEKYLAGKEGSPAGGKEGSGGEADGKDGGDGASGSPEEPSTLKTTGHQAPEEQEAAPEEDPEQAADPDFYGRMNILKPILEKLWMFQHMRPKEFGGMLRSFKKYVIRTDLEESEADLVNPKWADKRVPSEKLVKNGGKMSPGIQILEQGESPAENENVFVIQKGKLEVFIDDKKVNILKSGDFFGERAFVLDMPRGCTVNVVSDECVLWGLSRDPFEDFIHNNDDLQDNFGSEYFVQYSDEVLPDGYDIDDDEDLEEMLKNPDLVLEDLKKQDSDKIELYKMLKKLWVFKFLDTQARKELMDCCIRREVDFDAPVLSIPAPFDKREDSDNSIVVFEQNDMADVNENMYFLERGEVNCYLDGNMKINCLKPGSLFGELAFVFSLPRAATCRLSMPETLAKKYKNKIAVLWELDRDSFDKYIGMNDDFSGGIHSALYYKVYPAITPKKTTGLETSDAHTKTDQDRYEDEKGVLRTLLKDLWIFRHMQSANGANAELSDTFEKVINAFEKEEIKGADKRQSVNMLEAGRYRVLEEGAGSEKRDFMYVIEEGECEVMQNDIPINRLSAGDLFGELAFIYGLPRQASVIMTSSKLVMWRLSRDNFMDLIGDNEAITGGEFSSEYYKVYSTAQTFMEGGMDMMEDGNGDVTGANGGADGDQDALMGTKKTDNGGKIGAVFCLDGDNNGKKEDVVSNKEREMHHIKLLDLMEDLWVFALMLKEERAQLGAKMKRHTLSRESLKAQNDEQKAFKGFGSIDGLDSDADSDDDDYTKQLKRAKKEAAIPFIREGDSLEQTEAMWIIEAGQFEVYQEGRLVNTLRRGDLFGEQSLIYGIPRQATVSLLSDTATIWELPLTVFEDLIRDDDFLTDQNANVYYKSYAQLEVKSTDAKESKGKAHSEGTNSVIGDGEQSEMAEDAFAFNKAHKAKQENARLNHILKTTWIFAQMTDEERESLIPMFKLKKIQKPQNLPKLLILEEGQEANADVEDDDDSAENAMYLIESGQVEVTRSDTIVSTLGHGDFFGELALVYDTPRQASCYVTSPTALLWQLSKKNFAKAIRENSAFINKPEVTSMYYRQYDNSKTDELLKMKDMGVQDKMKAVLPEILKEHDEEFASLSQEEQDKKIEAIVSGLDEKNDVCVFNKGDVLPLSDGKKQCIYFIESGNASFFEGFQIISQVGAGELLGQELLDSTFVCFVSAHVSMKADEDMTKAWRICLDNIRPVTTMKLNNPEKPEEQKDAEKFAKNAIQKTTDGTPIPKEVRDNIGKCLTSELLDQLDIDGMEVADCLCNDIAPQQFEELLYNLQAMTVKQGKVLAVYGNSETVANGNGNGGDGNGNGHDANGNGANGDGKGAAKANEKPAFIGDYSLYYLEKGQVDFWDRWQLLGSGQPGELIGLQLLDQFIDTEESDFRYEVKEKARVWGIKVKLVEAVKDEMSSALEKRKNGVVDDVKAADKSDGDKITGSVGGEKSKSLDTKAAAAAINFMGNLEDKLLAGITDDEANTKGSAADDNVDGSRADGSGVDGSAADGSAVPTTVVQTETRGVVDEDGTPVKQAFVPNSTDPLLETKATENTNGGGALDGTMKSLLTDSTTIDANGKDTTTSGEVRASLKLISQIETKVATTIVTSDPSYGAPSRKEDSKAAVTAIAGACKNVFAEMHASDTEEQALEVKTRLTQRIEDKQEKEKKGLVHKISIEFDNMAMQQEQKLREKEASSAAPTPRLGGEQLLGDQTEGTVPSATPRDNLNGDNLNGESSAVGNTTEDFLGNTAADVLGNTVANADALGNTNAGDTPDTPEEGEEGNAEKEQSPDSPVTQKRRSSDVVESEYRQSYYGQGKDDDEGAEKKEEEDEKKDTKTPKSLDEDEGMFRQSFYAAQLKAGEDEDEEETADKKAEETDKKAEEETAADATAADKPLAEVGEFLPDEDEGMFRQSYYAQAFLDKEDDEAPGADDAPVAADTAEDAPAAEAPVAAAEQAPVAEQPEADQPAEQNFDNMTEPPLSKAPSLHDEDDNEPVCPIDGPVVEVQAVHGGEEEHQGEENLMPPMGDDPLMGSTVDHGTMAMAGDADPLMGSTLMIAEPAAAEPAVEQAVPAEEEVAEIVEEAPAEESEKPMTGETPKNQVDLNKNPPQEEDLSHCPDAPDEPLDEDLQAPVPAAETAATTQNDAAPAVETTAAEATPAAQQAEQDSKNDQDSNAKNTVGEVIGGMNAGDDDDDAPQIESGSED